MVSSLHDSRMVVELHCEATLPLRMCQTGQVVWRLPHHRPSVLEFFPSHFSHTAVESDDLSSIKGPIIQMGSYIITFLFPDSKIKLPEPMQVLFLKFCFVSPWLHLYYSFFFFFLLIWSTGSPLKNILLPFKLGLGLFSTRWWVKLGQE